MCLRHLKNKESGRKARKAYSQDFRQNRSDDVRQRKSAILMENTTGCFTETLYSYLITKTHTVKLFSLHWTGRYETIKQLLKIHRVAWTECLDYIKFRVLNWLCVYTQNDMKFCLIWKARNIITLHNSSRIILNKPVQEKTFFSNVSTKTWHTLIWIYPSVTLFRVIWQCTKFECILV